MQFLAKTFTHTHIYIYIYIKQTVITNSTSVFFLGNEMNYICKLELLANKKKLIKKAFQYSIIHNKYSMANFIADSNLNY